MLKVVAIIEAYLISYLISSLPTLLSDMTWQTTIPEVIHSSWTLHVVVVPRNLGYRKPTTTCDYLCFMLYMFKHKTERFALERDYYRTITFPAQYALIQILGCSCVVLIALGDARNSQEHSVNLLYLGNLRSLTCCREAETAAGVHFSWQWDNPRF